MPINVACRCGATIAAPDELAGQQIACPTCREPMQVPGTAAAPAPPMQTGPVANPQMPQAPLQNMAAGANVAAKIPKWMIAAVVASIVGVVTAGGCLYAMYGTVKDLQQRAEASDLLRKGIGDALKKEKERITELKEVAKRASAKQKDISTKLALQDTTLNRLAGTIALRDTELKAALADAKLGNEAAKIRAAELQKMIDEMNAEATVAKGEADQLRTDLTAANDKVAEADQKVAQANDAIANLQAAFDAMPPATVDNSTITYYTNPLNPIGMRGPRGRRGPAGPAGPLAARKVIVRNGDNFPKQAPPATWSANETVVVEMDTSTGQMNVGVYDNTGAWQASYTTGPTVLPDVKGRYDFILTEKSDGTFFDMVVLDTHTGEGWTSDAGWPAITYRAVDPQPILANGPRFRLRGISKSGIFTVTNTGRSLGAENTWVGRWDSTTNTRTFPMDYVP